MRDQRRTAKIMLQGQFCQSSFLPWIERYAHKLGVQIISFQFDRGDLEMLVLGPDEMVEALALGCSLGPKDAFIYSFGISTA